MLITGLRYSASRSAQALEELFHLGEEAGAFGMGLVRGLRGEFRQKLTLAARQILRRLDVELNEEVAAVAGTQDGHALAAQPELPSRLRPLRDADPGLPAVERPDHELSAERSLDHRDRHPAVEIGAVALENRMRLDREKDIEIAGRPAAQSRLSLAAEPNPRPVLDAGGNVDRKRPLSRYAAGAPAHVARTVDRLSAPVTGRAG